jgi:hypothetical protein
VFLRSIAAGMFSYYVIKDEVKILERNPWHRVLLEKEALLSLSRNSPPFMEPEVSFPCSQKSAT